MTSERTILITGVTGKQGGAVARALALYRVPSARMTRAPGGKRRRASVLRRWHARRASNTLFTHPWDRCTRRRASRTSTASGALQPLMCHKSRPS
jgi:hypothetical protein